jgi:hypothetical protein
MKNILKNITDMLADAALLEMGVQGQGIDKRLLRPEQESLEENLIEVAFAEAADYDQIHEAIMREHFKAEDQIHADECQYGDNDVCFAH